MRLVVNGIEYEPVKKPEEKKREPIKRWVNVYVDGASAEHHTKEIADRHKESSRLECVELTEIPKGSVLVNKDLLRSCWKNLDTFDQVCEQLGLEE